MDYKLKDFLIPEHPFYEWTTIRTEDLIYSTGFFQNIIYRQINLLNSKVKERDWVINYVGFAFQTDGFPYHADNSYPEDLEDRNMGTPDSQGNGFVYPKSKWIPNYVPTRIFTTVTYLNEVEGGGTHFPILNLYVKTEAKKLLGFHCDYDHIHGVLPTTNGIRKALIFWFD